MKKKCFVVLIFLFSIIITSCSKDDDNSTGGDTPTNSTSVRLSESINYHGTEKVSKKSYSYNGEMLENITEYSYSDKGEWIEDNKVDVLYPGENSFEEIHYNYNGDNWEPNYKTNVNHENGLWQNITSYSFNGTDWITSHKTNYIYNNNKIIKEENFSFYNGEMQNSFQDIYTWVGDTPSTVKTYEWDGNSWEYYAKDTLIYTGGKLFSIISEVNIYSSIYYFYQFLITHLVFYNFHS